MWNQSNYDKRSHICRVECKAQNEFVFCEIWQIALGCSSLYGLQLLVLKENDKYLRDVLARIVLLKQAQLLRTFDVPRTFSLLPCRVSL